MPVSDQAALAAQRRVRDQARHLLAHPTGASDADSTYLFSLCGSIVALQHPAREGWVGAVVCCFLSANGPDTAEGGANEPLVRVLHICQDGDQDLEDLSMAQLRAAMVRGPLFVPTDIEQARVDGLLELLTLRRQQESARRGRPEAGDDSPAIANLLAGAPAATSAARPAISPAGAPAATSASG